MPPSIDVLTSSSAPAWPTAPMALKSPRPSPNVMVPKQSFETRRPVFPSVAYCMGRLSSEPAFGSRPDLSSLIDWLLLPVAHQHVAAGGRELWAIFLQAGQNGKIALIHQLAAEVLHVARASLLLLLGAAMSKDAGRNRNRQQRECQENLVHCWLPSDFRVFNAVELQSAVHSIAIAWSFPASGEARRNSSTSGSTASDSSIISLKSSI